MPLKKSVGNLIANTVLRMKQLRSENGGLRELENLEEVDVSQEDQMQEEAEYSSESRGHENIQKIEDCEQDDE